MKGGGWELGVGGGANTPVCRAETHLGAFRASTGGRLRNRAVTCSTLCLLLAATFVLHAQPQKKGGGGSPIAMLEETGFRKIFDETSMKGWDCDPQFWRVENGMIVGETTANFQPPQNIFCIWRGGKPADFELKLEYRLTGADTGNSGIQYRSVEMPEVANWVLKGYQADIDAQQRYTGQIYEERARAFVAMRGQFTYIGDGKKPAVVALLGDDATLKSYIKVEDWNEMHIIARGNVIIQMINGHVMSQLIDDDKAGRKMDGLIGIQLHKTTGPMKIETRNIRLKEY
ncbi:MAG TPA: DUF1080 domain-containing protein [Bryobacteraceae bacterium]|nr:DUF1080 domain-containing protein [Bryobacteraceae bacterium]